MYIFPRVVREAVAGLVAVAIACLLDLLGFTVFPSL
jgi:hypothetical protein